MDVSSVSTEFLHMSVADNGRQQCINTKWLNDGFVIYKVNVICRCNKN